MENQNIFESILYDVEQMKKRHKRQNCIQKMYRYARGFVQIIKLECYDKYYNPVLYSNVQKMKTIYRLS